MDQFLRLWEVVKLTRMSRSTIYNRVEAGLFPKPISIGTRMSAWRESEVSAINTARIRGASDDEIRTLVGTLEASRTNPSSAMSVAPPVPISAGVAKRSASRPKKTVPQVQAPVRPAQPTRETKDTIAAEIHLILAIEELQQLDVLVDVVLGTLTKARAEAALAAELLGIGNTTGRPAMDAEWARRVLARESLEGGGR